MTETEINAMKAQLEAVMPQITAFGEAVQPLIDMFQTYLTQIGITMRVGTIYLKKHGKVMHGIIFEGEQESLEKLLVLMGVHREDVGEKEETG
jgi:hypothetical protein